MPHFRIIATHLKGRLIIPMLLLALTGCGSASGTFRVKNPFVEESAAIAKLLDPEARAEKAEKGFGKKRKTKLAATAKEEEQTSYPYFGRARGAALPATGSVSNTPSTIGEAVSAPAVAADPDAVSPSPSPAPSRSGAPCYRCNGKGHRLSSLGAEGEFITCEACGGSGRR